MPTFEESYLALRKKEGRLLSDEQVKLLPKFSGNKNQEKEWKLREKSLKRISAYLQKSKPQSILEIGCGNGWFASQLSKLPQVHVTAIDVNQIELDQAIRVFGNSNPGFFNADVFKSDFDGKKFDSIILNASIQYFPDLKKLIARLRELLNENGEIHILDTPFYEGDGIAAAKKRSEEYYKQVGFPGMAEHYFHHSFSELQDLGAVKLYQPHSGIFRKIFSQTPFPWIKLLKC